MEIETSHHTRSRVLAVDDEPVARQQLAFQLSALGHEAILASSAFEAKEILTREGTASFACLITDCWMPEQTGLDLLIWLRDQDSTLASIVASSVADKAVITQTLRGGASDFLEKPVFRPELEKALQRAFESSTRRRLQAATNSAVREAGLVQRRMNNLGRADEFPTPLTICYHPCHDAGGDSVGFFVLDPGRILVVAADVSGHDLKSAFISAYFQGMLRAMVGQKVPINAMLHSFNRFLIHEWSGPAGNDDDSSSEITSLSVCSASIDFNAGSVKLVNSGFPLANRIDRMGKPVRCGDLGGNPLGWIDPNPLSELSFAVDSADQLVIWTDGLEDFAHQLQISVWSLAFKILQAKKEKRISAWLADAPDDVLVVVIGLGGSRRELLGAGYRFPIVAESYEKGQVGSIGELQDGWRRSLEFAFPDLSKTCVFDVLLCAREAVLNGLLHGCPGESDRCYFAIVFDGSMNQLRIDVEDCGSGHSFDWQMHATEELADGHRGLILMHRIPERVEENSSGSQVRMFFALEHEAKEVVEIL